MSAVNEILDFKRHLVPLRGAYNASRSGMTRMLQSKLPAAYDPSRAYVDAAMSVFYDDPGSEDENAATLSRGTWVVNARSSAPSASAAEMPRYSYGKGTR